MLSAKKRSFYLGRMAREKLDLLVIGGGTTAAAIVRDASFRGMRAGLLDCGSFVPDACKYEIGSTLQDYLAWGQEGKPGIIRKAKVSREAAMEREELLRRFPHLIERLTATQLLGGSAALKASGCRWFLYRRLADSRRKQKQVSRSERGAMPPLQGLRIAAGGSRSCHTEPAYRRNEARLAMELLKSACSQGALLCNYVDVQSIIYRRGRIDGVRVADRISGEQYHIHAHQLIVAGVSPMGEHLADMDGKPYKRSPFMKSLHLVLDRKKLPIGGPLAFTTDCGMQVEAMPLTGVVYVRAVDSKAAIAPEEDKAPTDEDIRKLLLLLQHAFPDCQLSAQHVVSAWSAPLAFSYGEEGSRTARRYRGQGIRLCDSGLLAVADEAPAGVLRRAEAVVDFVSAQLQDCYGTIYPASRADYEPLGGGQGQAGAMPFPRMKQRLVKLGMTFDLVPDAVLELIARYGSDTAIMLQGMADVTEYDTTDEKLMYSELKYNVEHEMTVTLADFLLYRTGWLFFHPHRAEAALSDVTAMMGKLLQWGRDDEEWQLALLRQQLKRMGSQVQTMMKHAMQELEKEEVGNAHV